MKVPGWKKLYKKKFFQNPTIYPTNILFQNTGRT